MQRMSSRLFHQVRIDLGLVTGLVLAVAFRISNVVRLALDVPILQWVNSHIQCMAMAMAVILV